MPKRKTLEQIEANPKHVTPSELLALLEDHGWAIREGTRHGTIARYGERTILIPRSHSKHVLPVYANRVVRLIREADSDDGVVNEE